MKKVKYLFGAFIFGFGLLINQSFGFGNPTIPESDFFVEGVTLPLTDSNFQSSTNYLYRFHNYGYQYGNNRVSSLSYCKFVDGVSSCNFSYGQQKLCNFTTTQYYLPFNNSVYGLNIYYNWFIDLFANGGCDGFIGNQTAGGYSPIKISFGQGSTDFGKAFVYTNSATNGDGIVTPHYGFQNGFFTSSNYRTINGSTTSSENFYRLFYNQNVNLTSPLDGFDLSLSSGSNMGSGFIAYERFTNQTVSYQTQYNNDSLKYIVDYGSQGLKGLSFGGYGVGYSSAVDFSEDNSTLYWGNWSFSSFGSRCGLSAMQLGITDFNTITSTNCLNLGLLVLKGDSYVTSSNQASVIVLGKNPDNTKQILYEQFDCAEDDIIRIMDNSSNNFCTPIGHGYITINGNGDILPFENKQVSYTLGNGNQFLDFMFKQGIFGNITISNNQYCLNSVSSQLCFGLRSTPNLSSLKEIYLQNSGDVAGIGGSVGGVGINDIVINNPTSYYTYSGLLEIAGSSVFTSGFDINGIYSGDFINSGLGYTFINGVPALTEYHFGFCPFTSIFGQVEPTLSFDGFSFDLLSPFKCILTSFQYGYLNLNSPNLDYDNGLLINDPSLSAFIWIVFSVGSLLVCFKFLNRIF